MSIENLSRQILVKIFISLHIVFLLSCLTIVSCSGNVKVEATSDPSDPMVSQAMGVIVRTFGQFPENVVFTISEKVDGKDQYTLHSDGRILHVSGSSTIALCKGFYDYIL